MKAKHHPASPPLPLQVDALEREAAGCQSRIVKLDAKVASTKEELGSPMLGKLSEPERVEAE